MISKYFWDLNPKALAETASILKNPEHSNFAARMVTFLSRVDKPAQVFSVISKAKFIQGWPRIKMYWCKIEKHSDFRDWWQVIYENLVRKNKAVYSHGNQSAFFLNIGRNIRAKRISMNMSQSELALKVGMRQPHISKIEEGKMNITLATLMRICKVLEINNLLLSS